MIINPKVRVITIRDIENLNGESVAVGSTLSVDVNIASRIVATGEAVYLTDFKSDMLQTRTTTKGVASKNQRGKK